MAVVGEQLVGRTAEVGRLEGLIAGVEAGRPAIVKVAGEPGIGKTRLLTELSLRADARGLLVLSGCGGELQGDLPFWIFVDALDEYVHGLDPGLLATLGDEDRAELAHVLPSLSAAAAGRPTVLRDERYRAHHAVRRLLEALAARGPLVLALDDVHWADARPEELSRLGSGERVEAHALEPSRAVLTLQGHRETRRGLVRAECEGD